MSDLKHERFMEKISPMSDEDKALLAGCILEEVDPTLDNLKIFWEQLGTESQEELYARIEELVHAE